MKKWTNEQVTGNTFTCSYPLAKQWQALDTMHWTSQLQLNASKHKTVWGAFVIHHLLNVDMSSFHTFYGWNEFVFPFVDNTDTTESTDNTNITDNTDTTESADNTNITDNTDTTESADNTNITDNTDTTESADKTNLTDNTDTTESADNTNITDNTDTTESADITDITNSTDSTNSTDITEAEIW